MMKNQPSNPRTRCKVYADLTRTFPEGIFKGFTYPNLQKREDYTLRVLSGKRGETGSISVCESSEPNGSDEEEIDLGSDAETDNEDKNYEESAVSCWGILQNYLPPKETFVLWQSIIPGSQGGFSLWRGKPRDPPVTTPRKRRSPKQRDQHPPASKEPDTGLSTASPAATPPPSPPRSPGNSIGSASPGIHPDSPSLLSTQEKAASLARTMQNKIRRKAKAQESPRKSQENTGSQPKAPSLPLSADPFQPFGPAKKKKKIVKVCERSVHNKGFPAF